MQLKSLRSSIPCRLLDLYSRDDDRSAEARKRSLQCPWTQLTARSLRISKYELRIGNNNRDLLVKNTDVVGNDIIILMSWHNRMYRKGLRNWKWVQCLAAESSQHPYALAHTAILKWKSIKLQAAKIADSAKGKHPFLLYCLAKGYMQDQKTDRATDCLEEAIKISPNMDYFEMLADLYKRSGNMAKCIETQERFVDLLPGRNRQIHFPATHRPLLHVAKTMVEAVPCLEAISMPDPSVKMTLLGSCYEGLREWKKPNRIFAHRLKWTVHASMHGIFSVEELA